jgi:hypothetical protein
MASEWADVRRSGAKEAAEMRRIRNEYSEKHTSGAKDPADFAGFIPGIKSPAYRPNEFFRNL